MIDPFTYRVPPYTVSSFSCHELLYLPSLQPPDEERFMRSLKAENAMELVTTARLWENKLLPLYRCPFFLVRVADIRASQNSSSTALLLYEEAQRLMQTDDPVFNQFLAQFQERCHTDEENHRIRWSQGMFNQPWKSTSKFLFPIIPLAPEQMPGLRERWAAMVTDPSDKKLQYFRHFCIETNILEQAFLLDSQSIPHLIRVGYVDEGAEYISDSPLQDKHLIASILRDTHQALEMVWSVATDTEQLTTDFLIDLHRVCLRTSRILPVFNKDESTIARLKYINVGVSRQASRKNVILPGPPRVQFCPFDKVMEELNRITDLARQWLKNWKNNPFATAAWLHLVLVSCHPFEDGNGRVARLIASIPLIQAGLPPLCVPAIAKKAYYDGLNKARENNYDLIVRCFVHALEASISAIEDMDKSL